MNTDGTELTGWVLTDDGQWIGPAGERVRAIAGGQFPEGLGEFASQVIPEVGTGAMEAGLPAWETGGSGVWDFASGLGGALGKGWDWLTTGAGAAGQPTRESPLSAFSKLLGLGATGIGISSGLSMQQQLAEQTRRMKQGQKTAQAAASPAVAAGREQLAESRAGKLPPPMEAAVEQWKQQAKADMRARLAHMGLGESTDIQYEESRIDQMALAMKGQLLQSQESLALEALQTGVSAGTGVSATAQQQQQTLASLIQQANQQLGLLGGRAA